MATVTAAVDHDVDDKIDTDYVQEQMKDIDVSILFSCVDSDGWQNDTFAGDDGKPFYIIKLSYNDIKKMDKNKVRELMLEAVRERLRQVA